MLKPKTSYAFSISCSIKTMQKKINRSLTPKDPDNNQVSAHHHPLLSNNFLTKTNPNDLTQNLPELTTHIKTNYFFRNFLFIRKIVIIKKTCFVCILCLQNHNQTMPV